MYNHICYFSYISIAIKCIIKLPYSTSEFIEVKCNILKQFLNFFNLFQAITKITLNIHTKSVILRFWLGILCLGIFVSLRRLPGSKYAINYVIIICYVLLCYYTCMCVGL